MGKNYAFSIRTLIRNASSLERLDQLMQRCHEMEGLSAQTLRKIERSAAAARARLEAKVQAAPSAVEPEVQKNAS